MANVVSINSGDGITASYQTVAAGSTGWGYEYTIGLDYARVTDEVLTRLRESLPGEVRGLARQAGPLDPVAVAVLADWLEEAARAQMACPSSREYVSDAVRALWKDPDYQVRQAKSRTGRKHSDVARERRADACRMLAQAPEYQDRLKRMLAARWKTATAKAKMAASTAARWADSGLRQQHAAKVAKTYPGFVSPEGTIYSPVTNLCAFAREHSLGSGSLHMLACGQRKTYKGWRLYKLPQEEMDDLYRPE